MLKKIIIGLFLLVSVNAFSQANTYTYISLNGEYSYVTLAIADTTATATIAADVNYGTDTTWYPAYYFANFGTTATVWTTKTFAENTLLEFCDKAIRQIRFYLIGANTSWIFELKARR